jgi:cell wall-associated NlpC family hydrolase
LRSLKYIILITLLILFSNSNLKAQESQITNIDNFVSELNIKMDDLLKNELKRNIIGFMVNISKSESKTTLSIPDFLKRDTVFNISLNEVNSNLELSGQVLSQKQKDIVEKVAKSFFKNVNSTISIFPYAGIEKPYAISKTPFSDMYVKPELKTGTNLATQVRMGTAFAILEISQDKDFALVQSFDDKYISWINRKDILEVNKDTLNKWQNGNKIIISKTITKPQKIYFGTKLNLKSENNKTALALLPDGKTLTLNNDSYVKKNKLSHNTKRLIETAKGFLPKGKFGRVTYLWGGTIGNDLDCSGFVQTVFKANGIELPRDTDQIKAFTIPVGQTLDKISRLKTGDIIFFSRNGKKPSHVGIYIGNNMFIHSTTDGDYSGVKINSLVGGKSLDKELQKKYFGGGRVF